MEGRYYERACADYESRSKVIERAKKGKALYEQRQRLIKKIEKALKIAK